MSTEAAEATMTYPSIHRKVPLTGRGELVIIHSSIGYGVPPTGRTMVAPGRYNKKLCRQGALLKENVVQKGRQVSKQVIDL